MQRWSRRRIVVSVCAGLLLVWLITVVFMLVSARRSMTAGSTHLRHVRRQASIAALVRPASRADLVAAHASFDDADAALSSPLLAPFKVVPVASRHLRAAQRLVASAQGGTVAADAALRDLVALTKRPRRQGPERIETLRLLAAVAGRTSTALDHLDPGSPDALVGPLGHAITELDQQRTAARQAADRLQQTSLAVADVLQGPTPYLLLGANNAEMRNGSGMFLSASELSFDQGRLHLGEVRPTSTLVLPAGTVPATGDLKGNWPWLEPGRDLRNLGLTADFPQSAALAVRTWKAVPGGGPVAGTIVLDVDGIRSLLRVVGPVSVDGVRYTPDTVRGELLRKQYTRFAGDRTARRDQLGAVAQAIFARLEASQWKLEDLATELADAVQGRHLMVWSVDPKAERAWHDVGADGHLTSRSVSVGLLNRSAAKLDSWIDTDVDIETGPADGGGRTITLSYDVTNTAPGTGPAYLVGPNVTGIAAGDDSALAVVNLPAGSTDVSMTGAQVFLQGGDGPTVVVGGRLLVPRGKTAHITVTAQLPKGIDHITLEPSARITAATWTINGRSLHRDRRRSVAVS